MVLNYTELAEVVAVHPVTGHTDETYIESQNPDSICKCNAHLRVGCL